MGMELNFTTEHGEEKKKSEPHCSCGSLFSASYFVVAVNSIYRLVKGRAAATRFVDFVVIANVIGCACARRATDARAIAIIPERCRPR